MRLVIQRATRQAALDPGLRNESDQMLPQIGAEMRAALVTQAHDGDTAFTRRAAASRYRRRGAVFWTEKISPITEIMVVECMTIIPLIDS